MTLTCRILTSTIAKQSTVPASKLENKFKATLRTGDYPIEDWEQSSNGHFKVTFVDAIGSMDGVTKYKTWVIWGDACTFLKDGETDFSKDMVLSVPHMSQRDNIEEYWRTCNTSSHAMLLNFLKPGSIKSDDDYFRRFVRPVGDSADWSIHTKALRKFGIESEFRTDMEYKDIDRQLDRGIPVPIGVLHKGVIGQGVFGGHVLLLIGRDGDDYVANDPWGEGFQYINHNGRNVKYPKYPTLDARWMPGSGYGRVVTAIDGKKTGL